MSETPEDEKTAEETATAPAQRPAWLRGATGRRIATGAAIGVAFLGGLAIGNRVGDDGPRFDPAAAPWAQPGGGPSGGFGPGDRPGGDRGGPGGFGGSQGGPHGESGRPEALEPPRESRRSESGQGRQGAK